MPLEWLHFLIGALGGGLAVKLLDFGYSEFRRQTDNKKTATRFVDGHLDPLLKSADELVGKLCSLATKDFKPLHTLSDPSLKPEENNDFISLFYLLAKLWADIEIIRREGLSVAIAEDERGQRLHNFVDCLHSTHLRLVDRITQRAIGELLIDERNNKLESISFIRFFELVNKNDSVLKRWDRELLRVLSNTRNTSERQRLLQYGIVVHAMIDVLDPQHHVTRERPSYPHKLSDKTRKTLKYIIFNKYITFGKTRDTQHSVITSAEKYIGAQS